MRYRLWVSIPYQCIDQLALALIAWGDNYANRTRGGQIINCKALLCVLSYQNFLYEKRRIEKVPLQMTY